VQLLADKLRSPRNTKDDLKKSRNLLLMLLLLVAIILLIVVNQNVTTDPQLTVNELNTALERNQVAEVKVITNQWRAEVTLTPDAREFLGRGGERLRRISFPQGDSIMIAKLEERIGRLQDERQIKTILKHEEA